MSVDDTLKDLLNESIEPVEPPAGLAEKLIAKAGAGGAAAAGGASGGMFGLPLIIGIAVVVGVIIGGALGFFGGGEAEAGGTLSLDGVPAYACPGDSEVATLYRGDRVLITGRSGEWLAVRNVRGGNERVFIHSDYVTPDAALDGLPEENCDSAGIVTLASGEIVTTTTSTPVDTTTTTPGETTTTAVGATTTTQPATTTTAVATTTTQPATTTTAVGTTTTQPPTTTTTTQPPTTTTTTQPPTTTTTLPPPSVTSVGANPSSISEKFPAFPDTCPGTGITTVSAAVSAPAGVQSVAMSWSVAGASGSSPMTPSGGLYRATLGPFDANGSLVPSGQSRSISITVLVTDTLGRTDSRNTSATLNDCTFG